MTRDNTLRPTPWTRRLQLITAAASVVTTIGTALVLGYVTPEVLLARTDIEPADVDGFLFGFRAVGITYLLGNAICVAAPTGRSWLFWFAMLFQLSQGVGVFAVDFDVNGMRGLAVVGTWITDGGGALLGLVLLWFAVRYRTAWARTRIPCGATEY